MERQVFRMDLLGSIFFSAVMLSLSGFAVYNLIATQNYLNIIIIIVPLLFFIPLYKRRIIVEGGILYYKKQKVDLEDTFRILSDTFSETSSTGRVLVIHLFLMDEADNVLVHFDKNYVKGKKLDRFIKLVKAANPDVKIDI